MKNIEKYVKERDEMLMKGSVAELKKFIAKYIEYKTYSLSDYCDKRKSTDLTQFNYCPFCGKKIDWKAIKDGANG